MRFHETAWFEFAFIAVSKPQMVHPVERYHQNA